MRNARQLRFDLRRPMLVIGLLTAVPGLVATAEPPPPPVEPVLAPGVRAIDPRADELVRRMSTLLTEAPALAVEAEEVFDELPEDLPRLQLTGKRHVAMKRPDRLVGDAAGDALHRSFWYDGKVLSVLDREQNVYVSVAVPGTIDGALDAVLQRTGMVVPLADFLYSDVYPRLMGSVERGVYLGLHQAAGALCHHLAFEQPTLDWQLWIDAGAQPLPRKLVIAYKTEDGVPQYAVTMPKWNLKAEVPEALFHFEPPDGAKQSELPFLPPTDAVPAPPPKSEPRGKP